MGDLSRCRLTIVGGDRERLVVTRRACGRGRAPAALNQALLGGPSTSPLEVSMEQSGSLPSLTARVRRLRAYRLLANAFPALLAVAFAVLVFRWMFPWLFSALEFIWTADAFLLAVLAAPWLLMSWGLALGKIKCPSCAAPFAAKFHLWVPKTCHTCGYDITAPHHDATSSR